MNYLADKFAKEHGVDLRADKMALQRLKEAAEKAKKELSGSQTTNVNLPFITVTAEGPLHMNEDITRAKFDQLAALSEVADNLIHQENDRYPESFCQIKGSDDFIVALLHRGRRNDNDRMVAVRAPFGLHQISL